MHIKFLGAAGTVTGSGYVLTSQSGQSLLIDLGMFQGLPEIEKLNFSPPQISTPDLIGMVLTHAHLDHCGRIPLLAQAGFKHDIWMTPPTADLTEIALYDSARIAENQTKHPPLYTQNDVYRILKRFQTVPYNQSWTIGSFEVRFIDAGHILGSASIEIVDTSATTDISKIIFSGDLGNTPESLVMPTQYFDSAQAVVMESTYGDRVHTTESASEKIISEVSSIESSGGTLLIPAFSLERTQEILHILFHAKQSGQIKDNTPIYLDSPMAESATEVYEKYPSWFNDEIKQEMNQHPFDFPGLITIRHMAQSESLADDPGPKVIMAGSGMMTGGRIVSHAHHYLPLPSTRILFVGYQGEGTLGRAISSGEKHVNVNGSQIRINATVSYTSALSSHADQPRLLSWLSHISGTQKLFLTHGEDSARTVLQDLIHQNHSLNITLPYLNQIHEV